MPKPMNGAIPSELDVDSDKWQRARDWMRTLDELNAAEEISAAQIAALAIQWRVSRATVWRRVELYRRCGHLSDLVPKRRGRSVGRRMLSSAQEEIIVAAARAWWRRTENATISEIEPTVIALCSKVAIAPPSRATISRRLAHLRKEPANFVGEARQALRERSRLVRSSYQIEAPLSVVQIDHTVADVFVIDPISRDCIGRPTLTVAIDVATRCIVGHCLSLEAPSALLVALCLERAVFPKEPWLSKLGIHLSYPMFGLPSALHCDNGQEFHSAAFRRGCDLHNIETIYRPPATPRFGGHVERLIGTLMRKFRLLPGNSYSDMLRRRPRCAEKHAQLTLADLQDYLIQEIVRYHRRPHRGLGVSPEHAWEAGWTRTPGKAPTVPSDPVNFRLSFLPLKRRVVGREGIELFGLKYSSEDLAPHVQLGVDRVVRFDPRDLSRVYLETGNAIHLCVPLRDRTLPAFSLWEWLWTRRHHRSLAERGNSEVLACTLRDIQKVPTGKTALQSRRRSARASEWRELQRLQALPAPKVGMEATIVAKGQESIFAWEILE
jgi:putative transposase